MAGIAALHSQRQRHNARPFADNAPKVGNVLGDQHFVAEQDTVHWKIKSLRPQAASEDPP